GVVVRVEIDAAANVILLDDSGFRSGVARYKLKLVCTSVALGLSRDEREALLAGDNYLGRRVASPKSVTQPIVVVLATAERVS
ncbi:MAG: hypothetical protein ACREML_14145, partial [Vulcanimicrobiaceae bacterium]